MIIINKSNNNNNNSKNNNNNNNNNNNKNKKVFRSKLNSKQQDKQEKVAQIWITLQVSLINSKISLQLKWSKDCFLVAVASQVPTFTISDTKLYIPVVILSTHDNVKLLK